MKWQVIFHPEFEEEFETFIQEVQDELFAKVVILSAIGPQLQQFQIQGSYPKYPETKVAATQTKPALGGLRLPNWRVMTLSAIPNSKP
jgi:hypothetical protein